MGNTGRHPTEVKMTETRIRTGSGIATGFANPAGAGFLLWIIGALVALGVAAQGYLTPYSGIDGTGGALLVVVSSALLLGAGLVVGPGLAAGWLAVTLLVLSLLDVIGTAVAGYFLDRPLIIAGVVLALVGVALNRLIRPAAAR